MNHFIRVCSGAWLLCLLLPLLAHAQVNDEPCGAVELPIGAACVSVTGTTAQATASANLPAPTCTFLAPTNDVWFRFTLTQTADVLLTTEAGSIDDGVMQLFAATDCRTGFRELACNDDPTEGGRMPVIQARGLGAGTYYVRFNSLGRSGTFRLCARALPPLTAAFSVCDSILVGSNATTITYVGTASPSAMYSWIFDGGAATPGTGPGPHRVTWSVAGTKRVSLTVSENGVVSDLFSQTVSVVSTLPRPTARWEGASRTVCQGQQVRLPVKLTGRAPWTLNYTEGGTARSLTLGDATSCNPSSFTLTVTPNQTTTYTLTSIRDATGTSVSLQSPLTIGTTTTSPPSVSLSTGSGAITVGQAVTVTAAISNTAGATFNWNFDGGVATPGTGLGPHSVTWSVTGLKTVRLSVLQNSCESAPTTAAVAVSGATSVANDEPCGAIDVPVSASCTFTPLTTAGASPSGVPVPPACFGTTAANDVWFRFTLTQTSDVVVGSQAGTLTDAVMALYRATACGQLPAVPLSCDDNSIGLMPVLTANALRPGTYWVRVAGKGTAAGTFGLCVKATVIQPPTATFTNPRAVVCANDSINYGIVLTGIGPWRVYYTRTVGTVTSTDSLLVGSGLTPSPYYYGIRQRFTQATTLRLTGVSDDVYTRQPVSSSFVAELNTLPTATFSLNRNSQAVDQDVVVTYTGSATGTTGFNWNFDGAVVSQGTGRGPFTLKWLSPSTKTIGLAVEQGGCQTTETRQSVTITGTVNKLDSPCEAQDIPVNSAPCTGTYPTFSITGSTSTTGLALPACLASTQQRDIWLKFSLPTAQTVVITTQSGTLSDAALQLLSATACSATSFSQVGCDDDSGPGNMPELRAGLGTGMYYLRLWAASATTGAFGVCISSNLNSSVSARFVTPQSTACQNAIFTIPLALTGTSPWRISYEEQPDNTPVVSRTAIVTSAARSLTVVPTRSTRYTLRAVSDAVSAIPASLSETHQVIMAGAAQVIANLALSDSVVAVGRPVSVSLAGNADPLNGDQLLWTFDGATAQPGTGVGPHTLTWSEAGTRMISAAVNRGTCPTVTATRRVTITPANDTPCTAVSLGVNASLCVPTPQYSTVGATASTTAVPACNGTTQADVWFQFTTTSVQNLVVTTTAGTLSSASMQVLSAATCSGSFTQVACDAVFSGMPELRLVNVPPGTYYIRVWGRSTAVGSFGICLYPLATPTARFAIASPLEACPGTTLRLPMLFTGVGPWQLTYAERTAQGTQSRTVTVGATTSPSPFSYQLQTTPAQTTTYRLTGLTDAAFRTALVLRDSMQVTTTAITPTPTFRLNSLTVATGQELGLTYTGTGAETDTYRWGFDGATIRAGATAGPYRLSWLSPGPKVLTLTTQRGDYCTSAVTSQTIVVTGTHLHDQPCDAVPIDVVPYVCFRPAVQYSTQGATAGTALGCYTTGNDVWFRFTTTGTQPVTITVQPGTLASARWQILSAPNSCSGTFTQLTCQDGTSSGGFPTTRLSGLVAGTYYIRVSSAVAGTFALCVGQSPSPTAAFVTRDTTLCGNDVPVRLVGTGPWAVEYEEVNGAQRINRTVRVGTNETASPVVLSVPSLGSGTSRLTLVAVTDSVFARQTMTGSINARFVSELPVTFTPSLTAVATGTVVTFALSGSVLLGVRYDWSFADAVTNQTTGPQNQSAVWGAPGTKAVTLTASRDDCPTNSRIVNVRVTGSHLYDNPCQAVSLPSSQTALRLFANDGATPTPSIPRPTCLVADPTNDVWFRFVLTAPSDVAIRTVSQQLTTGMVQLLRQTGACDAPLTDLRCSDQNSLDEDNPMPALLHDRLAAGTYLIRMASAGQSGTFGLELQTVAARPPTAALGLEADTLCAGSPYDLPVNLTGQGPWVLTYISNTSVVSATLGDANTYGPTTLPITVRPTATTQYVLQSVSDGAVAAPQPVRDTLSLAVVNRLPTSLTIAGGTESCLESQTYSVAISPGTRLTWELSGGGTLKAVVPTAQVRWQTPGQYVLRVTGANFCGTGGAGSLSVIVSTVPFKPTLTQSSSGLVSNLSGNNLWYLNGTLLTGVTGSTYFPLINGNYTVKGQNQCGEGPLSETVVYVITGIESTEDAIQVYPNPAYETITIRLMVPSGVLVGARLIDLQGRVVLTRLLPSSTRQLTLPVGALGGTYLLEIQTDQQTLFRRVLIR